MAAYSRTHILTVRFIRALQRSRMYARTRMTPQFHLQMCAVAGAINSIRPTAGSREYITAPTCALFYSRKTSSIKETRRARARTLHLNGLRTAATHRHASTHARTLAETTSVKPRLDKLKSKCLYADTQSQNHRRTCACS